jgi:hypothetical protein
LKALATSQHHDATIEATVKRRPGQPVPRFIREEIERLAKDGMSPGEIERDLLAREDATGSYPYADLLPERRTIERYAKAQQLPKADDVWDWAQASPEEAGIVQPVLAAAIAQTDGRIATFSRAQAEWVVRIRRAVPEMPAHVVWRFATEYSLARDRAHLDNSLTVSRGLAGEIGKDRPLIAAHVRTHVARWLSRPLIVWARYQDAADAYINEVGEHASLVTRETAAQLPGPDGSYKPYFATRSDPDPRTYSWFEQEDFFGRLIIQAS